VNIYPIFFFGGIRSGSDNIWGGVQSCAWETFVTVHFFSYLSLLVYPSPFSFTEVVRVCS